MTKKYTNLNRLKRNETLREFKKFVNGMTNSESIPMFNRKDAITGLQSGNSISKDVLENISEFSDEQLNDISQAYLGTDGSCYFISDLFTGKALRSLKFDNKTITSSNLLKSITIVHDKDPSKNIQEIDTNTINKSVKSSMQYGNISGNIKKKESDKDDEFFITSGLADPSENRNTIKPENTAGFLDINQNPSDPNRITSPSLGAIVFNDGNFGLPTRGQDEISVFFNLINNIEMSLCSPYIYLKIISPKKEGKKQLSLEKTFRFKEKENIFSDAIEVDLKAQEIFNKSLDTSVLQSQKIDYAYAGLELFTSPQTLSNSNIARDSMGEEVLQPISSLLSLENIEVTISGLGIGLFASKVARMKLTLHDKSRLPDISELIAVEEFGQTKIILEYGWHHPHGDISSDNIFGQFLNTLRDGGVFNVTKTSFSIKDSSVSIDVDLAMVGTREMTNVSAACGVKVQSRVFKPLLEKIIEEEIAMHEDFYSAATQIEYTPDQFNPSESIEKGLKEIRKVSRIAVNEASSRNSLMSREKYEQFLELYYKSKIDSQSKTLLDYELREYFKIRSEDLNNEREKVTNYDQSSNLVREMSKKLAAIRDIATDDPFIDQTLSTIFNFKGGVEAGVKPEESNPIRENVGFNLSEIYSLEKVDDNPNRKNSFRDRYTSLGRVLMSFVGVPLATMGQYDEVQMLFYPLNHQSGGGHIFNMASFPIQIETLVDTINEEIKKNQNISVKKMCVLLEKIIRDPQNEVYLIKDEVSKISDLRKINKSSLDKAFKQNESDKASVSETSELKSNEIWELVNRITNSEEAQGKNYTKLLNPNELKSDDVNEIVNELVETHQNNIDNILLKIYKSSELYTEELIEPKFVIPNMSVYFETCNPFIISDDNTKEVDTSRNVLKIHIYDEESIANKRAQLLQNIITQGNMTISKEVKNNIISELENNPSKKNIKSLIKASMPSITLGSNMGQIISFGINANTSGNTSQALMITSFLKNKNIMNDYDSAPSIDDMRVVPTTANIEMQGFPLLQRGQQIYIDAKTNTTADNVYVVQSVSHNISAGSFKTSADLTYTGTASHTSIKSQILDLLKK